MKKIAIIGCSNLGTSMIKKLEMERGIKIVEAEKQNPFDPEPMLFTNPYVDIADNLLDEKIITKNYYPNKGSKYHK
jgi:pyrroline-5-carboxylate reductase